MNIFLLLTIASIISGTVVTPVGAMESPSTSASSSNSSLKATDSLATSLSSTSLSSPSLLSPSLSSTSALSSLTSSPVLVVTEDKNDSDSDDARNPNTVGKRPPAVSSDSESSFDDDEDNSDSEERFDFDDKGQDQFTTRSSSSSSSSSSSTAPSTDTKNDETQGRPRSSSISDEQSPPVERSIRARSFSSSSLIKKTIAQKEDPSTACSSSSSTTPSQNENIWHVGPVSCTHDELYNAYSKIATLYDTQQTRVFLLQFCYQQRNKRLEKRMQRFKHVKEEDSKEKEDMSCTYTIPQEIPKEFLAYNLCDNNYTLIPLAQHLIPLMISPSGKIIPLKSLIDLKIIQCDTDINKAFEDEFKDMEQAINEEIKRYKKKYPQAPLEEIKQLETNLSLAALNKPRWKITIHGKVFFLKASKEEIVNTYKAMCALNEDQRISIDRLTTSHIPPQKRMFIKICEGLVEQGLLWKGNYQVRTTISCRIAMLRNSNNARVENKTSKDIAVRKQQLIKLQQQLADIQTPIATLLGKKLNEDEQRCLGIIILKNPLGDTYKKSIQRLKKLKLITTEYIVPPLVRKLHTIGSFSNNGKLSYRPFDEFVSHLTPASM